MVTLYPVFLWLDDTSAFVTLAFQVERRMCELSLLGYQ